MTFSPLLHLELTAPRRATLAVPRDESIEHSVLGSTTRRRIYCLAHLYDETVPVAFEAVELAALESVAGVGVRKVEHPLDLVAIDGPRPDPRYCLQRLRALRLLAENRAGEISNDPVLPFRHQAALLQFLTNPNAETRVLVADEVGLGKTVRGGPG